MTYRERRDRKAERLRGWAESREAKASAALRRADQLADVIPFGQPILVGHHSEGRHRRDLARIEASTRAGFEHQGKAKEFRRRADAIETAAERAIYSDDPDAADRLAERIAELEAERERIKAFNASCRRSEPDESLLDERQRANLASCRRYASFQIGPRGEFPSYVLSNLSGNIARNRRRLEAMAGSAVR